ncbi:hypothetical protein MW887_003431 [Aspergillus wentii]|nr:hypothetical protein MW887_003431 [Aspergillus wentii]
MLELRDAIASEEKIIAEAQHRLDTTLIQTPTVETPRIAPPSLSTLPRASEPEPLQGPKRSHSESEDGLGSVRKIEARVRRVPLVMRSRRYTPASLEKNIMNGLFWTAEVDSAGREISWRAFCCFLGDNLDRSQSAAAAMKRYFDAKQRTYQSVTDFANYLSSLESRLPRLVSDEERIQTL